MTALVPTPHPGDTVNHRSMTRNAPLCALLAALALLQGSTPAAESASPEELPIFAPDTSVVQANGELQWNVYLRVENRFPGGIYFDSLLCVVQDLDSSLTRTERVTTLDVTHLLKDVSVSAGDSYAFGYMGPAIAEHARLTFRIVFHRSDSSPTTLTTAVEAMPGPFSRAHPSQFLTVDGRRIEYVFVPAKSDSAPALLLVHGRGGDARKMLRDALRLKPRGYAVMLASMPGFGRSEGPADFVGPFTLKALGAVLDRLKAAPGVDPKRLGAWGVARGAAAVTLLAQQRADLKATVAVSGFYDLWAVYRAMDTPEQRELLVSEAGRDSSAWRARSAALAPGKPAAILILHGERDDSVPPLQAHGFAESLEAQGAFVETRFLPNSGSDLPVGEVLRTASEFLSRRLGK